MSGWRDRFRARLAGRLGRSTARRAPVNSSSDDPRAARLVGDQRFVRSAPSEVNAIDLFQGEWWSSIPLDGVASGTGSYFTADHRPRWAAEQWNGVNGAKVLELGPLEGAHTYQLERMGAEVVAIEGNARCFLKCLVVKNLFNLRAKFLLGDIHEYLDKGGVRFDAVFASGVLYHSTDPIRLLHGISAATDKVFIWTHYFDAEVIARRPDAENFLPFAENTRDVRVGGETYRYHRQTYPRRFFEGASFMGGLQEWSIWLEKDDILRCLGVLGFTRIATTDVQPDHPGGPALSLAAIRK